MPKTPLAEQFGLRVRELRNRLGESQEAFAHRCGFARSYMSRIERGTANPALDAIERLAVGLGVEVQELFEQPASPAPSHATQPVLVPFAKDGSCFHPGLKRSQAGHYVVGDKNDRRRFQDFFEALHFLRSMTPPKWERPGPSGAMGVVTGVGDWEELPVTYRHLLG